MFYTWNFLKGYCTFFLPLVMKHCAVKPVLFYAKVYSGKYTAAQKFGISKILNVFKSLMFIKVVFIWSKILKQKTVILWNIIAT